MNNVGPQGTDLRKPACPRIGATHPVGRALRSDSHPFAKRHFQELVVNNVGPEGTDLRKPACPRIGATHPVGLTFTVRQPSVREATFSGGGGATKMSDLKAPTYEKRHAPAVARRTP